MAKVNANGFRSTMSAGQHFSMIPHADIRRSVFDRSHTLKTTFNEGLLIPIFVDEVLPGDSFQLTSNLFGRLSTPIVPFMDNLYLDTHFFFVPNRLVWDHWQAFNGEQKKPGDSTDYLVPSVTSSTGVKTGTVADYFGIPTGVKNIEVNELPFRAYNLIWNEWFRDENLKDPVDVFTDDSGHSDYLNMKPLPRGKRHDYFTSCLPWPQKGPGVEISLSNEVLPVITGGFYGFDNPVNVSMKKSWDAHHVNLRWIQTQSSVEKINGTVYGNSKPEYSDNHVQYYGVDARALNPITINDLRQAFAIQRLYEADARGGTRYTEILRAHFGVVSPDARLQRPEFLGSSTTRININPVVQTASTDSVTPQGNLAAFGVFGDSTGSFSRSFVEHGYIIGVASVRADLTYQQGLNKMWSRKKRFDFYWPALAHLGEQAVLNKEIYTTGTASDEDVFGYQERWAEYRYKPGIITGKMRSTDPQSLDVWHLAQKFDSLPTLSGQFIDEQPPISRVVAVQDEPHFVLDAWFELKCARPLPVYSVPGMSGHF